jgi:hypothetical protein
MRKALATLAVLASLLHAGLAQERLSEPYLERGELGPAREALTKALSERPGNAELQVQLALVQVLQSLQGYTQEMYRLGLRDSLFGGMVPFLRLPVEPNPDPALATDPEVRQAIDRFARGMAEARGTLAQVPDTWQGRVPLRLGRIRVDFDGDGVARPTEELWRLVDAINPRLVIDEKKARQFGLHLDAGDVRWLEGYCHMVEGLADWMLAYDTQRLFDHTGQLFFYRAKSPYPFLSQLPGEHWDDALVDGVTFIHLLDLPLAQAERMPAALEHFRQTIPLSRRSWACIQAETDDTYEWIPSPRQKSVIPGWTVSAEQLDEWFAFLDEAEGILAGRLLLPFWRNVPEGHGLNIARAFLEPQRFDAVLWWQGTAAAPYLEQGNVTRSELWERLDRVFDGQFFGFALWFN